MQSFIHPSLLAIAWMCVCAHKFSNCHPALQTDLSRVSYHTVYITVLLPYMRYNYSSV